MTPTQKTALITRIKEATAKVRDAVPDAGSRAKAIGDAIDAEDFGCYKERIRRLLSVVIGDTILGGTQTVPPKFTAVLVLAKSNAHDYALDKIAVSTGSNDDANRFIAIRNGGKKGNWLKITDCRYPTDAEIDAGLSDAQLDTLALDLVFV